MRDYPPSTAVADVADDLAFTKSRLSADDLTAELVPPIAALLATADDLDRTRRTLRREATDATALVMAAHLRLTLQVEQLSRTLLGEARQQRTGPLFRRFFEDSPSSVTSQGRPELLTFARVTEDRLSREANAAVAAHQEPLRTAREALEAAMQRDELAAGAARQHTIDAREPFLAEANRARRLLLADLERVRVTHDLPKRWSESFFRRTARKAERRVSEPAAPEPTPEVSEDEASEP